MHDERDHSNSCKAQNHKKKYQIPRMNELQVIESMLAAKSVPELEIFLKRTVSRKLDDKTVRNDPKNLQYWVSVSKLARAALMEKRNVAAGKQGVKLNAKGPIMNAVPFIAKTKESEVEPEAEKTPKEASSPPVGIAKPTTMMSEWDDSRRALELAEKYDRSLAPEPPTSFTAAIFQQTSGSSNPTPLEQESLADCNAWIDFSQEPYLSSLSLKDGVKPRYYTRVFKSYDWNKYNQAHYTSDNPPPKYTQGYKFRIFYPQLQAQGSNVVPSFKLIQIDPKILAKFKAPEDLNDYEYIVFSSNERLHVGDMSAHTSKKFKKSPILSSGTSDDIIGQAIVKTSQSKTPIYRDLVFRIVKKDWEANHKFGFKCFYDDGIFYLDFHFKKLRYRR